MSIPKLHVLALLALETTPITQEVLVDTAELRGLKETPQSLRSRLVELERAGYVRRTDRNGISRYGRPCWRWQLTRQGLEFVGELLNAAISNGKEMKTL